jgi:putative ABC transport system permease protein
MLSKDFVLAFRALRKAPVFTITAALTIAIGIGASTAIFTVANAVLLRPLPYKDPAKLTMVCGDMRRRNVKDFPLSNADFFDLRNGAKNSFEDFATVFTFRNLLLGLDGTPERLPFAVVSTNFFRLMGAPVTAGRDFQDADGTPQPQPPAGAPAGAPPATPRLPVAAIISLEYFQRRFGGDASIIGKPLPVTGGAAGQQTPIIVGVLSPGFELLFPPESNMEQFPSVWLAARIPYDPANRMNVQWRVVGRLKQGVSLGHAQSEVETVCERIRQENTISRTAGQYFRLEPMQQHLINEVRPAIVALMGAVVFLLLIACANVANLMLVRASLRERELAVRTALGGGSWRLIRQMLAEALVIAALGTAAGIALAAFGVHELLVIAPANLPRLNAIEVDRAVLGFSILAGLVSAVLFGLVPAIRAARPDINTLLRSGGRTSGLSAAGLLRSGVVVAEVALAFVLLIGSGLMFRTFLAIQRVDIGFDPEHLLTFQLLGNFGRTPPERQAFMHRIHDRLAAIPGVRAATASSPMPLAGGFSPIRWGRAEAQTDPSKFQAADLQIVTPGYFETMRNRLLAGRTFSEADNAPERKLLVVDDVLAAKAFPHESAVGKQILFRARTPEPQWGEIIGVVAHQRDVSLAEPGREQLFIHDGYFDYGAAGWWALRTEGDPGRYTALVRDEIRKAGSQLLMNQLQSMDARVVAAQAGTRFSLLLIGVFSTIAALLAAVGLYGVLSTVVRQRTAEIGLRVALGAAPARVFRLVVGQGLRLSVIGIAVGLVAAFELTRALTTMLVGVKPTDPATFASIAALFLVIAAVASWLPARRAAALDPSEALREE